MSTDEVVVTPSSNTNSEQAVNVVVRGQPLFELPQDLYIPPDALEVILEAFEGPLDLLLYLIKRQNLDILDIPIAEITRQYVTYIELMTELRLELAAEYLVMAAMLAEIKSRMLLPRQNQEDENEEDPRSELIRRLQEYEQIKKAAEDIDQLPRLGRDFFQATTEQPEMGVAKPLPNVNLRELLLAFKDVLQRVEVYARHQIMKEPLSIRERMTQLLSVLKADSFTEFKCLFKYDEGRMGVVVTFIAILELLKQSLIEMVQNNPYDQIHVRAMTT